MYNSKKVALLTIDTPLSSGKPNWVYACFAMLKSRGFSAIVVPDVERLLLHKHSLDFVLVGPVSEIGLTYSDFSILSNLACPIFIESGVLSAKLSDFLGLKPIEFNKRVYIEWTDPESVEVLRPFRDFIGKDIWPSHPIEFAQIKTSYVAPSPSFFKIEKSVFNHLYEICQKIILKRAFSFRFILNKKDKIDLSVQSDFVNIFCLSAIAARMKPSSHRRALSDTALRAINLGLPATIKEDEISLLKSLVDISQKSVIISTKDCAYLCIKVMGKLPIMDSVKNISDEDEYSIFRDINRYSTVHCFAIILWLIAKARSELAEKVLLKLCKSFLDKNEGSFFGYDCTGKKVWASHPIVSLALSCCVGIITIPEISKELIKKLTIIPGDLLLWKQSSVTISWYPQEGYNNEILAYLYQSDSSEDKVPAVWRQGNCTFLGYPILSAIGHAWTLPAVDEPLHSGTHHWIFLLEHVVMSMLDDISKSKKKFVIRHDVDRVLDDKAFEEIYTLYHDSKVQASWYWIYNRLNSEQIKCLESDGHEIGLHLIRNAERVREQKLLEKSAMNKISGETYHGAGADFHFGAISTLLALESGLSYSELHPFQYGVVGVSIGLLLEDGHIIFSEDCENITFSYSTDTSTTSRKPEVASDTGFIFGLLKSGYPACILNHPDLNRNELTSFLDVVKDMGAEAVIARELSLKK